MLPDLHIPLTEPEHKLCAQMGIGYYFGYGHLLKHKFKHTCRSVP